MNDLQFETPQFQAHGYVMGALERSEQGDALVLSDGQRLRVDTIRANLKQTLECVPPNDQLRLWGVYPRTHEDGTVSSLMVCSAPSASFPLGFTVSGQVIYCAENRIVLSIHRNRKPPKGQENQRSWQSFLITLNGWLPELQERQYWRTQCELKEGKLVVIDGVKLADAPACPPKPKKVKPLPKLAEATSAPEPTPQPRPKQVFDLSRLK